MLNWLGSSSRCMSLTRRDFDLFFFCGAASMSSTSFVRVSRTRPHRLAVTAEKKCHSAWKGNPVRHPSHMPGMKLCTVKPSPTSTHTTAVRTSTPLGPLSMPSFASTINATTPKAAPMEPNRKAHTHQTVKWDAPVTMRLQGTYTATNAAAMQTNMRVVSARSPTEAPESACTACTARYSMRAAVTAMGQMSTRKPANDVVAWNEQEPTPTPHIMRPYALAIGVFARHTRGAPAATNERALSALSPCSS
mmetsp:Transcript_47038/g.134637  ORF Transcript_47038/g.134637 Transcript_47038/m.134637 type:complete len:249 (+) Transcript_47038:178-924(+)